MAQQDPVQELRDLAPLRITQAKMREFMILEANYQIIKARYEEEQEKMLRLVHQLKVEQEDGLFFVDIEQGESRRPSWKKWFIKVASEAEAADIIANQKPTYSYTPVVKPKPTVEIG